MASTLALIFLSNLIISLISLTGAITLTIKEKVLNKMLIYLVSLAAGAMLGSTFIHLLPESINQIGEAAFTYVLAGFSAFFLLEKVMIWRHCHKGKCKIHTFAYLNLVGDTLHNFVDGMILAGSFIISPALGIATSVAVAIHEIPQEIGDFGVLIYAGFKKRNALLFNFASATTAIIGGFAGYFIAPYIPGLPEIMLALASGGFIYISATDLIPEISKHENIKTVMANFTLFLGGISLMYILKFLG